MTDADLHNKLGRMEATLQHVLDGQKLLLKKQTAHDERLNAVEHDAKMAGYKAGSAIGVGASLLIAVFKDRLGI